MKDKIEELRVAAAAIVDWRNRVGCFPWEMQVVRDMFDRLEQAVKELAETDIE